MTTVPDIPVVQLPALETDDLGSTASSIWAVDVPRGRRPSPLVLATLGVLAGIAAMALGTAAVLSAGGTIRSASVAPSDTGVQAAPSASPSERRVLALLAKPSTERVAFRGSRGLVLAVGSGGRAAILVRGLPQAATAKPYVAWIVPPGGTPVRAARFVGTERAVFLSRTLGPRVSVVVSKTRPVPALTQNRIVAFR